MGGCVGKPKPSKNVDECVNAASIKTMSVSKKQVERARDNLLLLLYNERMSSITKCPTGQETPVRISNINSSMRNDADLPYARPRCPRGLRPPNFMDESNRRWSCCPSTRPPS